MKGQQDRLLNLRLADEIDEQTFAAKNTELRDRIAQAEQQVQSYGADISQRGQIAEKAFELSQTLRQKWVASDGPKKRQLLGIVCLNLRLEGTTLVPTIKKALRRAGRRAVRPVKSGRQDLNLRPLDPQSSVLNQAELRPGTVY